MKKHFKFFNNNSPLLKKKGGRTGGSHSPQKKNLCSGKGPGGIKNSQQIFQTADNRSFANAGDYNKQHRFSQIVGGHEDSQFGAIALGVEAPEEWGLGGEGGGPSDLSMLHKSLIDDEITNNNQIELSSDVVILPDGLCNEIQSSMDKEVQPFMPTKRRGSKQQSNAKGGSNKIGGKKDSFDMLKKRLSNFRA